MKLLVLAQTPPPLHGQSVMVQALVEGLRTQAKLPFRHIEFRLSSDHTDIGRWRGAKIVRTLGVCLRTISTGVLDRCDTLYYVPGPGKRSALYRDWVVMLLCRPFFRRVVLHWHAPGLAEWLQTQASRAERVVTKLLLGHADLAIVLSPSLQAEATYFAARRVAIVPNGVPDPGALPSRLSGVGWQALFLGLCSEEKGLFSAAEAVLEANRRDASSQPFRLVAAGPFPNEATARKFHSLAEAHPAILRHAGFVTVPERDALFATSQCLIFPTRYPAEGLPLVALEALAHDIPVVATRWRALPDIITPECGRIAPSADIPTLAAALIDVRQNPPPTGVCRSRFLREFELKRHLSRMHDALSQMDTLA